MFLEIKGIKKHYGEGESRVEVLNGIDIEVNKGEIVVLLGPSGSGKSTLDRKSTRLNSSHQPQSRMPSSA